MIKYYLPYLLCTLLAVLACQSIALGCTTQYTSISHTLCNGQSYKNPNSGQTLFNSGIYVDTLFTQVGKCDSIITLNLTLTNTPPPSIRIDTIICYRQSITLYGRLFNYPQVTTFTYPSQTGGCDTSVTVFLSWTQGNSSENIYICPGDSVFIHGVSFKSDTFITDTLTSYRGCDSIIYRYIFAQYPRAPATQGNICAGHSTFTFRGKTYSLPGHYEDTVAAPNGCKLIYPLDVTSASPYLFITYSQFCPGGTYTFHGKQYNKAGIYYDTARAAVGCDSVFVLSLYQAIPQIYKSVSLCNGQTYTFNNHTYTKTGYYRDTLYSGVCDTLVNIYVAFRNPFTNIYQQICAGDTFWLGTRPLTQVGVYKDTFQAQGGCDSVVRIVLNPCIGAIINYYANLCDFNDSVYILGKLYTMAGLYRDSILHSGHTDTLFYIQITHNNIYRYGGDMVCPNTSYTFKGKTYLIPYGGMMISDTVLGNKGCDTITYFTVSTFQQSLHYITVEVCASGVYTYRDSVYHGLGLHYYYVHRPHTCDSVIALYLTTSATWGYPYLIRNNAGDSIRLYGTGQFVSYQWYLNGNILAGDTLPYIHVTKIGRYQLKLVDVSGCSDTTYYPVFISNLPATGIVTLADRISLTVSPNPSQGIVRVSTADADTGEVEVYDMYGRKVYDGVLTGGHREIDVSHVSSGTYLLLVKSRGLTSAPCRLIINP
jgi:hypothetical protein